MPCALPPASFSLFPDRSTARPPNPRTGLKTDGHTQKREAYIVDGHDVSEEALFARGKVAGGAEEHQLLVAHVVESLGLLLLVERMSREGRGEEASEEGSEAGRDKSSVRAPDMGMCGMGGRQVGDSDVAAGMAAAVAVSLCLRPRPCPLESRCLASSMLSLPLQAFVTTAFIAAAVSARFEAASGSLKAGPAPLTPSHAPHTAAASFPVAVAPTTRHFPSGPPTTSETAPCPQRPTISTPASSPSLQRQRISAVLPLPPLFQLHCK